jgi:hypothetical protein
MVVDATGINLVAAAFKYPTKAPTYGNRHMSLPRSPRSDRDCAIADDANTAVFKFHNLCHLKSPV